MKKSLNRRVLIVCEGQETEYNYFVRFRDYNEQLLQENTISICVKRGQGGNALKIVEHAVKEVKRFDPNWKRGDRVVLVIDTEGAGRAPELPEAEKLAKKHNIEIVYSSPAFEYWLLCHFEKAPRKEFKDCAAVIAELNKKWVKLFKREYSKSDEDLFNKLADRLEIARSQALEIDLHHLNTAKVARKTNPSTQMYELVAFLIGVQSGEKCPMGGIWELITDRKMTTKVEKGEIMPLHEDQSVRWCLP